MRILKEAWSAFERQIAESVEIQNAKHYHILILMSEYKHCVLPRLAAQVGEMKVEDVIKRKNEEKDIEQAELGVPHLEIQVELD